LLSGAGHTSANLLIDVPVAVEAGGGVAVAVGEFVLLTLPAEAHALNSRQSAKKGRRHRKVFLVMYGSCMLNSTRI
jgi:hypothetical protein